jgi:hypothetical protein
MMAIQFGQRPPRRYRSASTAVPDSILDNPEHCQERAEEARSIAEQMSDPDTKQMMLRIAEDYERLAATPGAG